MRGVLIRILKYMKGVAIIGLVILAFLAGYKLGPKSESHYPPSQNSQPHKVVSKPGMWTCSMHPQIKLQRPGKCPICFMDLVPVEEGVDYEDTSPRRLTMSNAAKELAEIRTAPVERKSVTNTLRMVGKIEYDETRQKHITAWIPGRIDALYVDYTGVEVKKGDPMVSIYSPELLAAQQELIESIKTVERVKESRIEGVKERAASNVLASKEKLRLFGLRDEQIEEIEKRRTVSDHVTIFSPISGIVTHKHVLEGVYVKVGTKIYTICDLSEVWVNLSAYESDMIWVKEGQEVEFEVEAYPGEIFKGRIAFIDPFMDERTRTIKLRVNLPNPDGRLRPGMFVRAQLKSCLKDRLVIPATAPLITGRRAIVYVEVPNTDRPTYEGREIVLGPRAGDYYVVKSGLKEGERVVVEGNFKIDSALQIQAKPSMMSPPQKKPPSKPEVKEEFEEPPSKPKVKEEPGRPSVSYKALSAAIQSYLHIQHALAADDFVKAQVSFIELRKRLISMTWMKEKASLMKATKVAIDAEDITSMRAAFAGLSEVFLRTLRQLGHRWKRPLYEFHCPMALNGAGASWVQDNEETSNPYFGASMLRCGVKKTTFTPKP